jgi:hypothetical protein
MPPMEFETTISAGERPQTYALGGAATGTDSNIHVMCTEDNIIDTIPTKFI